MCLLTLINGGGPLCTIQRLKPIYDTLLSSVAFNFNLRHYIMDWACPGSLGDLKEFKTYYSKNMQQAQRFNVDNATLGRAGWVFKTSTSTSTRPTVIRPISVYHFLRGTLTLCPQLYMGIQPGARFPLRSAATSVRNSVWAFHLGDIPKSAHRRTESARPSKHSPCRYE